MYDIRIPAGWTKDRRTHEGCANVMIPPEVHFKSNFSESSSSSTSISVTQSFKNGTMYGNEMGMYVLNTTESCFGSWERG